MDQVKYTVNNADAKFTDTENKIPLLKFPHFLFIVLERLARNEALNL